MSVEQSSAEEASLYSESNERISQASFIVWRTRLLGTELIKYHLVIADEARSYATDWLKGIFHSFVMTQPFENSFTKE